MSGPWDHTMKKWAGVAPQDFVSWLLGDAVYKRAREGVAFITLCAWFVNV
jgi:hypothetical protein